LVRVECGFTLTMNNMNGEVYYNWSAFPAIITSNTNLDAAYDVLKHMRSTILYNPEWELKANELNRRGNAANAEIAQKDFENVKNYREAINTIHQGISNDRNNSNDRNSESVRDVLGGEAKFENPNTGERVRLDDQYKHYYTDAQGNYYGSYEPLDYKAMSLTEVNRLDTKKY
jgi:predicted phage gp36 major capsid-like protein